MRTHARLCALSLTSLALWSPLAPAAADESEATWNTLREEIVGARPVEDGSALIELVAPKRAEDAALVPLQIRLRRGGPAVKSVMLVIDENPAPVAATIRLGEGRPDFELSTRVRVNSYSYVRAIADTGEGALRMVKAYVKAAGGCSAPATKDPEQAKANLGEIRFRAFADVGRDEAQVAVRHPNYSGLQMDQVTRLYTPAWYVETLEVSQGDRLVFAVEGGISISEDPTFRFSYRSNGDLVTVRAKDTQGNAFQKTFPAGEGS